MRLPRPVWLLGWVSFFTDTASEMIYPLLPLFVTRVLGGGALSLGLVEGVAEAANSLLKILSGRAADRSGNPKPLVLAGYGISSAVRPFIAIAGAWWHVLALRVTDRLGKGIRGAPRDAMLASYADAATRGRVFGFHRAMDHAGAVLGPLLASLFLYVQPGEYRTLFALTIVPGIVVMIILARVPSTRPTAQGAGRGNPPAPLTTAAPLPAAFYRAMAVIALFSVGNATDAFLLLRFSDVGIAPFWIPFLWSALHVVKAAASLAGGRWSDAVGRRHVIALGWVLYAAVYGSFAASESPAALITVFLVYGLFFGLTEGVEKAWVADLAPPERRGSAFGIYNAVVGAGALASSVLFGLIWTRLSPSAAFLAGAACALAATALLYSIRSPRDEAHSRHE